MCVNSCCGCCPEPRQSPPPTPPPTTIEIPNLAGGAPIIIPMGELAQSSGGVGHDNPAFSEGTSEGLPSVTTQPQPVTTSVSRSGFVIQRNSQPSAAEDSGCSPCSGSISECCQALRECCGSIWQRLVCCGRNRETEQQSPPQPIAPSSSAGMRASISSEGTYASIGSDASIGTHSSNNNGSIPSDYRHMPTDFV